MKTMFDVKKKPYHLLLFTAIVMLFSSFILPITINMQDIKMFDIPLTTMLIIIPLFLVVLWLIYLISGRILYSSTISSVHVWITVIATITIMAVVYIGIKSSQTTNETHELVGISMQILSLIIVFAQLIYLANVVLGLFRKQQTL